MPYLGCVSFRICTRCTRMYNGMRCPACGDWVSRSFAETTTEERKRWQDKKHYGDPSKRMKEKMDG